MVIEMLSTEGGFVRRLLGETAPWLVGLGVPIPISPSKVPSKESIVAHHFRWAIFRHKFGGTGGRF